MPWTICLFFLGDARPQEHAFGSVSWPPGPFSRELPWDLTWKKLAVPSLSSTTSTNPQIERRHRCSVARTPHRGYPPLIYHDLQRSSLLHSARLAFAAHDNTKEFFAPGRPSPSPPFLSTKNHLLHIDHKERIVAWSRYLPHCGFESSSPFFAFSYLIIVSILWSSALMSWSCKALKNLSNF